MEHEYTRQTDVAACVAIILLLGLEYTAQDGVSTMGDIVDSIQMEVPTEKSDVEAQYQYERYEALLRTVQDNPYLQSMVIDKQSRDMGYDTDGLNAAVFTGAFGNIVAYLGTGMGEWNDNGVALLGVAQTNTYYKYDKAGHVIGARIVEEQASTQQAQALDYFNRVATMLGWRERDSVIVTGHSKGGNKAQFVALTSPLVGRCYSFNGQGFSPEAVAHYRELLGEEEFSCRIEKIHSFSTHNDFVNVLGDRITLDEQTWYFDAGKVDTARQYHELHTIVSDTGGLKPLGQRGDLSYTAERLWEDGKYSPNRAAVCMAVMTACEHYFGSGVPINGEFVSNRVFLKGTTQFAGMLVKTIAGTLFRTGVDTLSEEDSARITSYHDTEPRPQGGGIRSTLGGLVNRALTRRSRDQEREPVPETSPQPLEMGSDKPYFKVDPRALERAAVQLADVQARTQVLIQNAQQAGDEKLLGAIRYIEADVARLERCQRHLAQTARDFTETDSELARLAALVL